jgi:hypothetical protein
MLSNRWIGWLLVAVVTVMMSACGGGGGSGSGGNGNGGGATTHTRGTVTEQNAMQLMGEFTNFDIVNRYGLGIGEAYSDLVVDARPGSRKQMNLLKKTSPFAGNKQRAVVANGIIGYSCESGSVIDHTTVRYDDITGIIPIYISGDITHDHCKHGEITESGSWQGTYTLTFFENTAYKIENKNYSRVKGKERVEIDTFNYEGNIALGRDAEDNMPTIGGWAFFTFDHIKVVTDGHKAELKDYRLESTFSPAEKVTMGISGSLYSDYTGGWLTIETTQDIVLYGDRHSCPTEGKLTVTGDGGSVMTVTSMPDESQVIRVNGVYVDTIPCDDE